jgi:hypothetical protein
MNGYSRNRACSCARCRCTGYIGPATLITLGVLFLIDQYTQYSFHSTWPIILIVIGVIKLIEWNAPITGHVNLSDLNSGAPPGPDPGAGVQPPSDGSQVTHG